MFLEGCMNLIVFFEKNTLLLKSNSLNNSSSRTIQQLLKLCQNKKDQTFVEMHNFLIVFICSRGLIKFQKKDLKNGASHQTFGPSYFVRALNPKTKQEN